MDTLNLNQPDFYIGRELSLLEFNRRVIEQATDEELPLLERLRFLCIASSNLDEFFEIRVAGLRQQVKYGSVQTGPDNLLPQELLNRISEVAHRLVEEQYRVMNEVIQPALAKERIRVLRRSEWAANTARWVKRYFSQNVLPVLSPIGLDPAHPFPRVLNKSLNFIVEVENENDPMEEPRITANRSWNTVAAAISSQGLFRNRSLRSCFVFAFCALGG